jgi:hypothetical protein
MNYQHHHHALAQHCHHPGCNCAGSFLMHLPYPGVERSLSSSCASIHQQRGHAPPPPLPPHPSLVDTFAGSGCWCQTCTRGSWAWTQRRHTM